MATWLDEFRAFAQGHTSRPPLNQYKNLVSQQPSDFLSWPWIKQQELFKEYLKYDPDTVATKDVKIDFSPLLWCKQARDDALKIFCEQNYLIHVQIFAEAGEQLKKNSILLPSADIQVPMELFDDDMIKTLKEGVTLHMQVGTGCGIETPTEQTNVVYERIFGFNKYYWAEYCSFLSTTTFLEHQYLTMSLHKRNHHDFRDLIPDFLLCLSYVRGLIKMHVVDLMSTPFFAGLVSVMTSFPTKDPSEWHNLMVGILEEAKFQENHGHFDISTSLLARGFDVSELAWGNMQELTEGPQYQEDRKLVHGTLALCNKLFLMYASAIDVFLNTRVLESKEGYLLDHYIAIQKMARAADGARSWCGMTSNQLAGFHFVAGCFSEHLGKFITNPTNKKHAEEVHGGPFTEPAVDYHVRAARQFYTAAQIHPSKYGVPAMRRWNAIFDKHGTGRDRKEFEAELTKLTPKPGVEWFGNQRMWSAWDISQLYILDEMREKEVRILSKSGVKKLREKMGLGKCRKEPAGLLRCLAK